MKPYIKKIKQFRFFNAWYVDGSWIRKNLEKDFVAYGDYIDYRFIPKNEIWIEQEFSKKESDYYINYYLEKHEQISKGKTIEKAADIARLLEKKQRNQSKIIKHLKKLKKDQQIKKIHKKLLKKYSNYSNNSNNNVKVWIVSGFLVRSLYFLDFTAGGHDLVYRFIPKNEIWIDDAINPKELKFTLLHELHERNLMQKGWCYDPKDKRPEIIKIDKTKPIKKSAHDSALKIEDFHRKNPSKVYKRILQEIQNFKP